ncbi:response regulator transcription factor [Micromonospora sp. B11E3]|uniref:response regulator transcription factor n=1 Tax=Micromonospora sp. B11E3 TaxID=3153562 RepID=UPI00325CE56A
MTAATIPRGGRVRVAGVDDDTIIRDGLQLLLPQLDVVATFADAESLLAARPQVDVVLLDLKLDGTGRELSLRGIDAVRAVAAAGHRVLVYTNERRRAVLAACLTVGALGIAHKAEPLDALADAVAQVAAGHIVITQALTGLAEVADRRGRLPALSPRERQVLAGRARGESFRSIAARLYVSEKTAAGYMEQVKAKFAAYLRDHSPADLEYSLGLEPADLPDRYPHDPAP